MIVFIAGSRKYPHRQRVIDYVQSLPPETVVISGGAKGVDSIAIEAARARGMQTRVKYPEWPSPKYRSFGEAAKARSAELIKEADEIVCFWDGESRGTKFTIQESRRQNKQLKIITSYRGLHFPDY